MSLTKRYYAAAASDEGAIACTLIVSSLAKSVPEDYGRSGPFQGKTCPEVMAKVFKRVAGQPSGVLAATKVTGIRISGNRGFVQLSSSAMPTGEIYVLRKDGMWKVGALIGRACTRCSAG